MEISAGWVGASATIFGVISGLVANGFRQSIGGIKATQKLLFEKHDAVNADLQAFKLTAAKEYVNGIALEKALAPIESKLSELREDLKRRDDRG